jgi:hypothetical protein
MNLLMFSFRRNHCVGHTFWSRTSVERLGGACLALYVADGHQGNAVYSKSFVWSAICTRGRRVRSNLPHYTS